LCVKAFLGSTSGLVSYAMPLSQALEMEHSSAPLQRQGAHVPSHTVKTACLTEGSFGPVDQAANSTRCNYVFEMLTLRCSQHQLREMASERLLHDSHSRRCSSYLYGMLCTVFDPVVSSNGRKVFAHRPLRPSGEPGKLCENRRANAIGSS